MDHNLSSHCSPMTFLLFFWGFFFSSYLHCRWADIEELEKDKRIQQKVKRFKAKQALSNFLSEVSISPPFSLSSTILSFFFFFSILFFSPLILWPSLIMVAVCMLNSGVLCWYYSGFLNNLMHAKAIKRLTSSPYLSCTQSPLTCCLVWFTS